MPDAVRGRVFTLLDLSWSAMRLLSLVLGGLIADVLGVRPLVWGSGSLLALTGVLGLVLLVALYVLVRSIPDINRYRRVRKM